MKIRPQRLKEIIQEEVAAFREQSEDPEIPKSSVQAKGLADYGPPETALASAKMTIDKMAKTGQKSPRLIRDKKHLGGGKQDRSRL